MFEKVNPSHPDKIADRIAGAIVDLAYVGDKNPKVAVEVLIGHGACHIIVESSVNFEDSEIKAIVERIAGDVTVDACIVPQDEHLANNQDGKIRCGDNGIFRGVPTTGEQKRQGQEAFEKLDIGAYSRSIFGMFGGKEESLTGLRPVLTKFIK